MTKFKMLARIETGLRYDSDVTEDQKCISLIVDNWLAELPPFSTADNRDVNASLNTFRFPLDNANYVENQRAEVELGGLVYAPAGIRARLAVMANNVEQFAELPATSNASDSEAKEQPFLRAITIAVPDADDLFLTCLLLLERIETTRIGPGVLNQGLLSLDRLRICLGVDE